MAEQTEKDQQTEKPTHRRLEEARRKGNLPMSRDVTAVMVLGLLTILLAVAGGTLATDMARTLQPLLAGADAVSLGRGGELAGALSDLLARVGWATAPVLAVLVLAAVIGSVAQNGLVIAAERIKPKFERVSPVTGLKRMFSRQSAMELVKGTLKIAVIGVAAWMAVRPSLDGIDRMPLTDPSATGVVVGRVLLDVLIYATVAMLILAVLDAGWQRFTWWRGLFMSREELRDEHKQMEGSPEIKGRIKMLRRQRARQRMMAAVPGATVVITNPTHFAVALVYDRDTMRAPKCVAKGQDRIAQRIREVAVDSGVPVVENKPLARALFGSVEVDEEVPPEHYRAVAEVISYVLSFREVRA
jgi:flagellar biosynthetic protein FlhB